MTEESNAEKKSPYKAEERTAYAMLSWLEKGEIFQAWLTPERILDKEREHGNQR